MCATKLNNNYIYHESLLECVSGQCKVSHIIMIVFRFVVPLIVVLMPVLWIYIIYYIQSNEIQKNID